TASFPPTHPLYRRRPIPTQGAKTSFALLCGAKRYRIFGVDLTAIPSLNALTAYTLLAEVGTDGSKFRNIHAFASWACFCPHNKKSGGKVLSAKPAGLPIASIAPCGWRPRPWKGPLLSGHLLSQEVRPFGKACRDHRYRPQTGTHHFSHGYHRTSL